MNASELRIGNLVSVKYTDSNFIEKQGITRVIGLSEEGNLGDGWKIEIEALEEDFENGEAYPIELTEEILLKCGFKYSSKLSYNDCMTYYLHDELEILWLGYLCLDINNSFIPLADTELKYLHQLQNLYYCLVGTELEIEL